MDRLGELKKIFENIDEEKKTLISFAIEELVYIEDELKRLKKYPFILYNKKTGETKTTAASRRYHSLEQQYINYLKTLSSILKNADVEDEDSFDLWMKQRTSQ